MPKKQPPAPPLELKEACVRAARELIAEHGIERLSLREVSRKLGVSHQAPYKHYPSRDHLLAEVMRRCFVSFSDALDDRPPAPDVYADLRAMGERYLAYAAKHPLEYHLMFGTPWPESIQHPALIEAGTHAFEVLRGALRRYFGAGEAQRERVEKHAMFIWATMHGLSGILHAHIGDTMDLAPGVVPGAAEHALAQIEAALRADDAPAPPAARRRATARKVAA